MGLLKAVCMSMFLSFSAFAASTGPQQVVAGAQAKSIYNMLATLKASANPAVQGGTTSSGGDQMGQFSLLTEKQILTCWFLHENTQESYSCTIADF